MSSRRNFLDEIDFQIINELKKDARIQLRTLAAKLEMAVSTVLYRVQRLEEEGIIKGYHADVDLQPDEDQFNGEILIKLESKNLRPLLTMLMEIPEIITIYQLTGPKNLMLIVKTKDHKEFISKVYDPILNSNLVEELDSNIITKILKE